jgi:hypothetical protein
MAFYRFKMSLFGAVWLADLWIDQPYLLIRRMGILNGVFFKGM